VRFSPGSRAREPEQPLTEGGLEKPCLDGLLVVVLANHSNAVITKQQFRPSQRGLRDGRKKQPTPVIELREEFLGTQHRAGRGMRLDAGCGADHDARARNPNALPVGVRRRKRDGTDGGAEAKILRHLEPPYRSLQRARRAQHAVRGIIDQHHRIAGFERGVLYLLFAFLELAAKVSCKMLANHRVAEHARIAVEIAFCCTFEDLALAPTIAVSNDIASVEGANVVTRRLGDDVVKGGMDQVVPLRRQRRLGPVVFDIVRSPKDLYVLLLSVATHDA